MPAVLLFQLSHPGRAGEDDATEVRPHLRLAAPELLGEDAAVRDAGPRGRASATDVLTDRAGTLVPVRSSAAPHVLTARAGTLRPVRLAVAATVSGITSGMQCIMW